MGRSIKGRLTWCNSNTIRHCNVAGLDSLYTLIFVHDCLNIGGKLSHISRLITVHLARCIFTNFRR